MPPNVSSSLPHAPSRQLYSSSRIVGTNRRHSTMISSSYTDLVNKPTQLPNKSSKMNRLIGRDKMFNDSKSPRKFQRLIALPGMNDNDTEANAIKSKELRDSNKIKYDRTQNGPDRIENDNLNSHRSLITNFVEDKIGNIQINRNASHMLDSQNTLILKDITNGENIRAKEISESNEVVHELLEIVYTESKQAKIQEQLKYPVQANKQYFDEDRENSIISTRLQAVVENWKNDESFALSSKDSWTLRRGRSGDEQQIQFVEPSTKRCRSPTDDIYYHSQIPIRQRLRESWRSQQVQNHYIRKLSNDHQRTNGADIVSESGSRNHDSQSSHTLSSLHLLPHPDDLLLMPRKK